MNAGTAEESLAPIAYSRFSETEEAALRWFLAGAGKIKLPFDTRTYTVRSFRKAKFKSAFWGTFVVTGLITLIAVGSGVQAALTATSLDDLCARLADAPIIAAVLVGGHVFFAAVVFLMIGGLGGSQLAKPDEQLAIRHPERADYRAAQPAARQWPVERLENRRDRNDAGVRRSVRRDCPGAGVCAYRPCALGNGVVRDRPRTAHSWRSLLRKRSRACLMLSA